MDFGKTGGMSTATVAAKGTEEQGESMRDEKKKDKERGGIK